MDAQDRVVENAAPTPIHWSWKQQHHFFFSDVGDVITTLLQTPLNDVKAIVCDAMSEKLYGCKDKKAFLDVITSVCNEEYMMDELKEAEEVYDTAHHHKVGDDNNLVIYLKRLCDGYHLFIVPTRFLQ